METVTLALEPGFDFRSPEYLALHAASETTPFQGSAWLDGLHRIVAPDMRAEPITLTGRTSNGRLAFLAPLVRQRRYGLSRVGVADFGLSDYQHLVYDKAQAKLLLADPAIATRMARLIGPCDYLSLEKLGAPDPVLLRLFPRARLAPMRLSTYPVKLEGDWPAWRARNLDPTFSRSLDRKRRRLNRAGKVRFERVENETEILRVFAHIRRFRAHRLATIGAPDVTAVDSVFRFYCAAAVEGVASASTATFCLFVDDEPVSAMFGLIGLNRFWLLLTAFDPHRYGDMSIGLLGTEDSIRACLEQGLAVYDFTIGDHAYKRQFGAARLPLFELHQPFSLAGHVGVATIKGVREAKRVLRPVLGPPLAWLRRRRGRR